MESAVTVPIVGASDVKVRADYCPELRAVFFYVATPDRSVSVHLSCDAARELMWELNGALTDEWFGLGMRE